MAAHRNLGKIWTEIEAKAKESEGKEKEEAEYLIGRLKWYVGWLNAKAKGKIEDGRPSEAIEIYTNLTKLFRGHEAGDKAEETKGQLHADAGFKKELGAESYVKAIETAFYKIRPTREGEDMDKWTKRYWKYVKQVRSKVASMQEKYGNTKVFKRIQELTRGIQ
ncbi:MAG: hypothetical protein ACYS47_04940 [Planctomycetota bacterium]